MKLSFRNFLYVILGLCLSIMGLIVLAYVTLVIVFLQYGVETLPNNFTADGIIFENYRLYDRGYFRIKDNDKIVVPAFVEDVMWSKDAVYGQRKNQDGSEVYYFYSRKESSLQEFTNRGEFDNYLIQRRIPVYSWGKARNIFSLIKENGNKTYEKPPYTDWMKED